MPDVIAPGLRVLFVGINPGVATARARRHFANPRNVFWSALHEGGLTPRRLAPDETEALLALGLGITNAVTRATPGSADVTPEDVRLGRERVERVVGDARPVWLAFVGKQAFQMATGSRRCDHGAQAADVGPSRAFVLPSTSPANAAVPAVEKIAWFRRLADAALA